MLRAIANTLIRCKCDRSKNSVLHGNNGSTVVELKGLTIFQRHHPVLRDIDLSIQKGETLAIMGPNGAGKSTLLKCLCGAARPTRGEIRWFGVAERPSSKLRHEIGYVGHQCGLYCELTALENLIFAGRMHGIEHPAERALKMLEVADLLSIAHRSAGILSHGTCRRLAIARTLLHQPRLILLDEPFDSLDTQGQAWLDGLFYNWRKEGQTVCFVSHNICKSRDLADRIVWLNIGQITAIERVGLAAA